MSLVEVATLDAIVKMQVFGLALCDNGQLMPIKLVIPDVAVFEFITSPPSATLTEH